MDALKSLLDAAKAAPDAAARQQAVRAALASVDVVDLPELEKAAAAQFAELSKKPESGGYDADAVEAMGSLVDIVDAVRAESSDRANTARIAELAERMNKPAEPAPAQPAPAEPAPEQPAPAEPAPAPAEPTPAPAEPTPAEPAPSAPAEPQAEVDNRELAVVAAGKKNTVPLGSLPKNLPAVKSATVTLTAAADIPGVPMGSILDGVEGLTRAAIARLQALGRAGKNTTAGIAVIERLQTDERLIATRPDDYEVVNYATDEKRLPGGSLVAAAGWCAPPEQIYNDFCPVATVDGLVSLPSITARRGSITWPTTPDFSQIYSNTGFYMSIEEMEKGEGTTLPADRRDKPCYLIQCTGTQSAELDVYGLCVKVPTLTERAYPELVSHVTQQILAAHAHKMNAVSLRKMQALATANTIAAPAAGTDAAYGPGATTTMLGLIELQVEYLRSHYRLGMTATMEMVVPSFVRGILRSDLAKRNGVDMLNITDAQLDAYFRSRGVNPQYVVDWQDAFAGPDQVYNTTDATTAANTRGATGLPTYDGTLWGGATLPKTWPNTVTVLIYPAGTYFRLTNDIITVDGMYDSALLARNLHLALFTEEGMEVALKGCYTPIALTMPLTPTGATGEQIAIASPAA